ncbi:MAG: RluA family pseudouridine synthase [Chloroflexi bacterium]|nr:RluA family pseudouridine synthase [Chloroflexota bacterium]
MAEQRIEWVVDRGGERLDKYLVRALPRLSRARIQSLIEEGRVTVEGHYPKPSQIVSSGQHIRILLPPPTQLEPLPEALPLDLVYEDQHFLVLNKPAGMVVHPAPGHAAGTLVNALLARYPHLSGLSDPSRAGIVHRLDKDTSGLLLVAKDDATKAALQAQFKTGQVVKIYLGLVEGRLALGQGIIQAPIGRHPRQRKKMAVISTGKAAATEYRALEYLDDYTLVELRPRTGRTHQIRVHLASLGHPLAGDPVYGHRKRTPEGLGRVFLHAQRLGFRHPRTGEELEFAVDLPPDLAYVLDRLRAVRLGR